MKKLEKQKIVLDLYEYMKLRNKPQYKGYNFYTQGFLNKNPQPMNDFSSGCFNCLNCNFCTSLIECINCSYSKKLQYCENVHSSKNAISVIDEYKINPKRDKMMQGVYLGLLIASTATFLAASIFLYFNIHNKAARAFIPCFIAFALCFQYTVKQIRRLYE